MWYLMFAGHSSKGKFLTVAMILALFLWNIDAMPASSKVFRVDARHPQIPKSTEKSDTEFVYAIEPVIHPLQLRSKPNDPDTTWFGIPTYMMAIDTEWNYTPIVVGFFDEQMNQVWIKDSLSREVNVSSRTIGYVFVFTQTQQKLNQGRRYAMEAFGDSGAKGEIVSVIFANADRDPKQEMGILIRTSINSHGGNTGCYTYYNSYFFDDLAAAKGDSLKPLSQLNQKIGTTVVCNGATEEEYAELLGDLARKIHAPPYRDVREVKARLKRLGY